MRHLRFLPLGGLWFMRRPVFAALALVGMGLASPAVAVEIIAHRGASYDAPENTLAALRLGWQQGADANEMDVHQTKDGQIVVIHDKSTKRTTGIDKLVADQTLAELRQQDAGTWKGQQWAKEKVPTLAEALEDIPAGKRVLIEIKCSSEVLPELARVLAASGKPPEQLVIIGFDYATMALARRLLPRHEVYWVVGHKPPRGSKEPPSLSELAQKARRAGFTGLDLNYEFPLDEAAVSQLKQQGLKVLVWTVDEAPVAARLAAAGVDGITTNRPQWIREQLAHAAGHEAGSILTIAGTGRASDGGSGGAALETNIGNPFGVEVGPDGALYITEVTNHRVRRLDLHSGELTTVAGNGRKGYSGDGGPATEAMLNEPYEVRFDDQGNMYFVEMQNHLVRMVDKRGRISTIAGTGKPGYGGDGGPALAAQFRNPHSIALDGRGGLYVADIGNHRIRRIDLKAGTIESVAGNGEKRLPTDGELIKDRPIFGPRALYISGRTMWIALREGNSVWRMDLDRGTVHHVAGTGAKGFTGDGGPARQATFNGPKGIALGPDTNLVYVADTENQVIRRIDVSNGTITTIAGSGPRARGYGGDDGPATAAKMNRPHGVCVGPDGTVYIGDSENHRVRAVAP